MATPKRIKRSDVILAFTKGKTIPPQSTFLWFTQQNTLFYGDIVIAVRDPVTLIISKSNPDSFRECYSGSELAAMLRGQNEIELYLIKDSSGKVVAENLPWFDAIQTKKAMKKEGLTLIKIE